MTSPRLSTQTERSWPGRKRRSPIMGIGISAVSLALLVGLALLMNRPAPQVTRIVTASALDQSYEPVTTIDSFQPLDTFFVSVKIANYRSDEDIRARWRLNGNTVGETPLQTNDTSGDITAGFSLSSQKPWPDGRYSVDILYGDTVLSSADFHVGS